VSASRAAVKRREIQDALELADRFLTAFTLCECGFDRRQRTGVFHQVEQLRGRIRRDAAPRELFRNAIGTDLVELVHGDDRVAFELRRDSAVFDDRTQEAAMIDPQLEVFEAEPVQTLRGGAEHFGFHDVRARSAHVDIALIELAEPTLARVSARQTGWI